MRAVLKWGTLVVALLGLAAWALLSIRLVMPISEQVRMETPAGPIEFRLVVLPSGPVRIDMPSQGPFWNHHLPTGDIHKIFSNLRDGDSVSIRFPSGADLSMRRDDGSWSGFWTAPPSGRTTPHLPVRFVESPPVTASGDPAAMGWVEGRWKVQAADGTSGVLELSVMRDGSGVLALCEGLTGALEIGGHADAASVRLAHFDGTQAMVIHARLGEDGALTGDWWDSRRGLVAFTATRADRP